MGLDRMGNWFEDIGEALRPIWDTGGRQDVRVRDGGGVFGSTQPRRDPFEERLKRQLFELGVQILNEATRGSFRSSSGKTKYYFESPISGRPLAFGSEVQMGKALDALDRGRARQRSFSPLAGAVLPTPARDLSTTASFPLAASAQDPILAGSRGDPFGFIRPSSSPAFGTRSRATASRFRAV